MSEFKLKNIFKNKRAILTIVLVNLVMAFIALYFIDIQELIVNFSMTYAIIEIILHVLLSLELSILLAIFVIKPTNKKASSFIGSISGIFGMIITGCPVCGVTLMSLLGIVGFLNLLPRFGLEIKFVSVLLVLRSIDYAIRNFNTCSKSFFKGILPSRKKTLIVSMIFIVLAFFINLLLEKEEWMSLPEYNIKLHFPKDYSVFWYDLSEGCSDTKTFREFYGKDRNLMLVNLKIFTLQDIKNFTECLSGADPYPGDVTMAKYDEYINTRRTHKQNSLDINGHKFIINKSECIESTCQATIRTLENNNLLVIDSKYKINILNNLEEYVTKALQDLQIEKI